jgi:hypothetical protein
MLPNPYLQSVLQAPHLASSICMLRLRFFVNMDVSRRCKVYPST